MAEEKNEAQNEFRGGVITQVLHSIGVAGEEGIDVVSPSVGEIFQTTTKSVGTITEAYANFITKILDSCNCGKSTTSQP